MMNDDAIELTERYVSSLEEYFGNVPDDRLLAMIMNPLLATCGFKDLTVLLEDKGVALVTRATQLLRCSMQKLWKKKLAGKRRGGEGDGTSAIESLSLSMTPLERLRRSREEGRGIKASETDPIKNAVDEWLNQDFSPEEELRKQRHRMRRDCNDIDWMRVNKQETLYISSIFDLCEWWLHVVSVGRHTLVYLVLPAIIALSP
jgi:hypothetical protein